MVLDDWSRPRLLFTVLFSLLFVSGVFVIVMDVNGSRVSPSQYLFVALDAIVVGLLVFRPDLFPESLVE